jgi:hypothetical protein
MLQIVASLTDNCVGVIYDHYVFIIQATGWKDLPGANGPTYLAFFVSGESKKFIGFAPKDFVERLEISQRSNFHFCTSGTNGIKPFSV